jgi:hypothetical protein
VRKFTLFIVILVALILGAVVAWWVKSLDSVGYNYIEETVRNLSQSEKNLEEYIKNRRGYKTDIEAFETLDMIFEDQKGDKYAPWLVTKLGLVRFDDSGFIEKICFLPSGLNDSDCPPQL